MTQIHKIFTVDQIKVLFSSYDNGHISRTEIENTLGIGNTEFQTSLFPKNGHYLVPIKNSVRDDENLEVDDEVTVLLEFRL